jgi:hypothetical protein
MVEYLQAAYPSALPRWRGEITSVERSDAADGRGRAGATLRREGAEVAGGGRPRT